MTAVMSRRKPAAALPAPFDEIEDLVKRGEDGDVSVLPRVREILDEFPGEATRLLMGDLAFTNNFLTASQIAGRNPVFCVAIEHNLDALRSDLEGPAPSPIERLLVERCLACWLQLQRADMNYEHHKGELPIPHFDFLGKQRDRAHRRFLQAIKTLATVRKLALPVLQVNFGKNQVNVAQGA